MKKLKFFSLKPFYFLLCLIFGSMSSSYAGQQTEITAYNAKQIVELAENYVKQLFPPPELGKMQYRGVALDKRIKIKPCAEPLQTSIPGSAKLSKQTTVRIRCPDNKRWSLYVQVRIEQQMPVVVAKTTLAPGIVIGEEHLSVAMINVTQLRGRTLNQPDPLYGAKINRYISAGQAVTMRHVCLVCKGDMVTVIAKLKGLRVKTSGISQQNGSLGDNIAILNRRSSKRINAQVVAVNQVEINL